MTSLRFFLVKTSIFNPSFFKDGMSAKHIESIFNEACVLEETCSDDDLERKEIHNNKQKAVRDAMEDNYFEEVIDAKEFPILASKGISITSDADITPVLRDIVKLSKRVKSVDLLKVVHLNGATTTLVEIPCY